MQTPHYSKIGNEGIMAIVETAKSLGVDPRQALGGGLYYVRGKVEMSSRMMNALIRSRKHSVTRDKKSDDTICILHGKRSDNGDTWTESFSMDEAKKAGLVRNGPWTTFPRDMLFARALSRLARQLFPDIIGNCYVEGEISLDRNIMNTLEESNFSSVEAELPPIDTPKTKKITEEKYKMISFYLDQLPIYKETISNFLGKKGIDNLWDMPEDMFDKIVQKSKKLINEQEGRD